MCARVFHWIKVTLLGQMGRCRLKLAIITGLILILCTNPGYDEDNHSLATPNHPGETDTGGSMEKEEQVRAESNDDQVKPEVVNPHPFPVVLSNPDLCSGQDLLLLVYVHTALSHTIHRNNIRNTWGNITRFPNIRILFVMGVNSGKPALQQSIAEEAERHKDILQVAFEDTYRNLTYKGIAALKWISKNCNNAKYILKTDDDVFVNMFSVEHHLESLYSHGFLKRLILCLVWRNARANRRPWLDWGPYRYPYSHYPTYCSGMAFILSTDLAYHMHQTSLYIPYFWVDDVYITGLLVKALGTVHHRDMTRAYCPQKAMLRLFSHPQTWHKYAFTHIHDHNLFASVWHKLVEMAQNSSIPTKDRVIPGVLT